jgi:hypothetical protein
MNILASLFLSIFAASANTTTRFDGTLVEKSGDKKFVLYLNDEEEVIKYGDPEIGDGFYERVRTGTAELDGKACSAKATDNGDRISFCDNHILYNGGFYLYSSLSDKAVSRITGQYYSTNEVGIFAPIGLYTLERQP